MLCSLCALSTQPPACRPARSKQHNTKLQFTTCPNLAGPAVAAAAATAFTVCHSAAAASAPATPAYGAAAAWCASKGFWAMYCCTPAPQMVPRAPPPSRFYWYPCGALPSVPSSVSPTAPQYAQPPPPLPPASMPQVRKQQAPAVPEEGLAELLRRDAPNRAAVSVPELPDSFPSRFARLRRAPSLVRAGRSLRAFRALFSVPPARARAERGLRRGVWGCPNSRGLG